MIDGKHYLRLSAGQQPMIVIEVSDRQRTVKIDRRWFARLATFVCGELKIASATISLAFVGPRAMRRMNVDFLGHDYVTDVLTFPLSESGAEALEAEIVVCPAFAVERSTEYNVSVHEELGLYVTHGLLHLVGYDDHETGRRRTMNAVQKKLLSRFLRRPDSPPYRPSSRS
jgi:probable rRNA maturation factor